ncbi:hypothetical protein ABMY23_21355 [Vibrio vulnificus]|uniref:hypothetical protein n=2 Tax=Vibrio vulnificus TaxID=672 RepID=UPI004059C2EE
MVRKSRFTVVYVSAIVLISFGLLVGINFPSKSDIKWTDILSSVSNFAMAIIAYLALDVWKSQLKHSKRVEQIETLRMQLDVLISAFNTKLLRKYDQKRNDEGALLESFNPHEQYLNNKKEYKDNHNHELNEAIKEYTFNLDNYQSSFGNPLPESLMFTEIEKHLDEFEQELYCCYLNQEKAFPVFYNSVSSKLSNYRIKMQAELKDEMSALWK